MPETPASSEPVTDLGQITAICSGSAVIWVRPTSAARPTAAWFVWHEGTILVLSALPDAGPNAREQRLPDLSGPVEVIARAKDTNARALVFIANGTVISPSDEAFGPIATLLKAARLNASAQDFADPTWAQRVVITVLTPQTVETSTWGPDSAEVADAPARGPATTGGWMPFHLRGRPSVRRRLRKKQR